MAPILTVFTVSSGCTAVPGAFKKGSTKAGGLTLRTYVCTESTYICILANPSVCREIPVDAHVCA